MTRIHHSLYNHRALIELPDCEDFDELVAERIEHDVTRALAAEEPADHLHAAGVDAFELDLGNGGLVVQLLDLMRDTLQTAETSGASDAGAFALARLRILRSLIVSWAKSDRAAQRRALDSMLAEYQGAREDAALERAGV